jgi:tripartite-type tricarboxylate transporter receptor subunit TctC
VRGSRFALEQQMIEQWLQGVVRGTRRAGQLGHEIALCGRLIKGYGSTNERGKENLLHVLDHLARAACRRKRREGRAAHAKPPWPTMPARRSTPRWCSTARPPRPVKAVPIRWMRKPRGLAADEAADGYTLLMSSGGTVSINPHLYPKMSFDPAKDLVPVAAAARVLVYLEVNPGKVPAKNAQEFLAHLKANPGKLSYGSPGNGSSPHLAAEMMKAQGNVFATHIPYRGAAPAMQDLLAGQVDFMFDPGIGLQHVKSGKLKLLAVGSPKRSPQFPDVPTMEEAGLKGFDADTWFGFYAAAGTPAAVVTRLNTEINKILRSPAFVERMNAIGGVPSPMSPQEFAARAQSDSARFGALIKARNIQGD